VTSDRAVCCSVPPLLHSLTLYPPSLTRPASPVLNKTVVPVAAAYVWMGLVKPFNPLHSRILILIPLADCPPPLLMGDWVGRKCQMRFGLMHRPTYPLLQPRPFTLAPCSRSFPSVHLIPVIIYQRVSGINREGGGGSSTSTMGTSPLICFTLAVIHLSPSGTKLHPAISDDG